MSKERLEEIKQRLVLLHNAADVDDETKSYIYEYLKVEWLIERVQELEEIKSEAIKQIDVTQRRNKRLEERVRELEQEVNDLRDEAIKWNKRFEESEESHLETKELLHSVVMLNKRYKQALEFYADASIYNFETETDFDVGETRIISEGHIFRDFGRKAREALECEE